MEEVITVHEVFFYLVKQYNGIYESSFSVGVQSRGWSSCTRFKARLDAAIKYNQEHKQSDEYIFITCGRRGNVMEIYEKTESQVAKEYILNNIPEAIVIKEDISVDTIGNFAFAQGIINELEPDEVIIFMSDLYRQRVEFLTHKIFGNAFTVSHVFVHDEWSVPEYYEREEKAVRLMEMLLTGVEDGDGAKVRNILLYKTPYYFKGVIADEVYFNKYWEGGFADYVAFRATKNNA